MPPTETKIKDGALLLNAGEVGEIDVSCQPTNVRLTPAYDDEGDRVEVLCGDVLEPDTVRRTSLAMTAIQDFSDPDGLVAWTWAHDLERVPFEWWPRGTTEQGYGGTVEVRALELGGDVNKRLTSDAEWKIIGDVAILPAVPA